MTRGRMLLGLFIVALSAHAHARAGEPAKAPLYYQDPDGKPSFSAAPTKTTDGRPFTAVYADAATQVPALQAAPPAPSADHRILYYRNPMGLADTSPKPKKDPMGMDYVPVFADEAAKGDAAGTVRISPTRIQTLGVRTTLAQMRPSVAQAIRATAIVQFDERHLATVTTKVAGWIEHLAVSAVGDPVRKGQTMAEIYAPDLVASEEEYLVAARMGGTLGGASVQRLRAQDVPEGEIARLRRTGRASRIIAVAAPENGVVIDKPVQEGMRVDAGEALYRTADLSDVWVIAQVQEQDLGAILPGASAKVSFVAFPGRTFAGRVEFIYPSLAAETRTAKVRIVVPNRDGALRAAMYADVRIEAPNAAEAVLSVPASAVIDNGLTQIVLIDRGEGRFEPRRVRVGVRGDDWVAVTNGLREGDRVVTGANFLIDAESNLRAALAGFAAGGGQ